MWKESEEERLERMERILKEEDTKEFVLVEKKPNRILDRICDWVAENKGKSLAITLGAFYIIAGYVVILIYMAKR